MFFRQIVAAFFDRTRPASSMQNPAAMNMTTMPISMNDKVLKMKVVSGAGAVETASATAASSCANALPEKSAAAMTAAVIATLILYIEAPQLWIFIPSAFIRTWINTPPRK